jgi:hypothetical protein
MIAFAKFMNFKFDGAFRVQNMLNSETAIMKFEYIGAVQMNPNYVLHSSCLS